MTTLRTRRVAMSTLAALCAALLLIVAWAGVAAVLQAKRRDDLDAERRHNTNLARALTEQTLRVFAAVDQATIRTRDAVAGGAAALDLERFAGETGLVPGILAQLSLIDAHGRFVGSNLDPGGRKSNHVDLSSRDHVRVHLSPAGAADLPTAPGPDGLYIGMPVKGKVSGRWTIQLSRRIAASDGSTIGVVVASLDPSYFEQVYREVSLGGSGAVALVGSDLGVRARVVGGQSSGMGTSLDAPSAFLVLGRHSEGDSAVVSAADGQERLIAFQRVGPYPVFVTASTATDEALSDWRGTRDVILVLTGSLSLVVVAATVAFVIGLRRLERSNDALRKSEALARSASQAKTQFLAAMSHELRTPLTAIRGFAELLELRLEDPRSRDKAVLIRKGAERLNDLLTDILDMTHLEGGSLELRVEAVAIRPLVQDAVELFAVASARKGLALTAEVARDVPETLQGDALRLRQILHNLLSNAIKFTPAGQVRLLVDRHGESVRFHVVDTGPGVAADMRAGIFEVFRQGSARVSYEHGGTGLGLALVRALAERMHGTLELAAPDSGGGARFTLELPLGPAGGPTHAARECSGRRRPHASAAV